MDAISKTYRLWATPGSRLWVPLLYRLASWVPVPALAARLRHRAQSRLHHHEALSEVSFSLGRGEALGIIGHNGSGKSTLLQIIAGVLQPTHGRVEVRGRVAALLELGSGFNPELTGRENVRVNAAILGLTSSQIRERMDAIVAFADIGDFIDEPVKAYSSGMGLRLAFAVQVHTDPDILIVDEALAVGDAAFQAKAMARIDEILKRGTTLLFVGHDLNAVKAFCQRAMLLENGRIVLDSAPEDVINEYLYRIHTETLRNRAASTDARVEHVDFGFAALDTCVARAQINGVDRHVSLRYGQPIRLDLTVRINAEVSAPYLILDIMDGKGLQISGRRIALGRPDAEGSISLSVDLNATLQKGVYRFRMRLVDAPTLEQTSMLSRQEGWLSFDIVDDSRDQFTGLFPLPMTIEMR
ncbi:MAG: ABC transporter ATP-binding protein [Rhodanobacter sp.]